MLGTVVGVLLLIFVIMVLISCVQVVQQSRAVVIERLGAYQATWGVGIHFKIPFIERVARRGGLVRQDKRSGRGDPGRHDRFGRGDPGRQDGGTGKGGVVVCCYATF